MATGAMIATGVGGIAAGIGASRKADKALGSAENYLNQGLNEMKKYFDSANLQGEEALQFAQQMLTDWEETFGKVEDNLSEYYNELDPAKYSQEYKTALNENIDKQLKQTNEYFASTGLLTSGMQAQSAKEAAFAKAQGGAQADLMADDKVASMKQGFLNTGANQKSNALSANLGAYGNLANLNMNAGRNIGGMYGSLASQQNINASTYGKDAAGFLKGGLENFAGGLARL